MKATRNQTQDIRETVVAQAESLKIQILLSHFIRNNQEITQHDFFTQVWLHQLPNALVSFCFWMQS